MSDFTPTQRDKSGRVIGWKGTAKEPPKTEDPAFAEWKKKNKKGFWTQETDPEWQKEKKKQQGGWGNAKP